MADTETGFRWWVRYVIVPLIGTGGVVAILAAWITKPVAPSEQPAPAISKPTPGENQGAASLGLPSPSERARTSAAKWIQALVESDVSTIVEMAGEPIHILGETFLTKAALRTSLEEKRTKPSKASIKDLFVTELTGRYKDLLPFSEAGDFIALVPGPFTPPLDTWIAIHLRPRGEAFIVLRVKETKVR